VTARCGSSGTMITPPIVLLRCTGWLVFLTVSKPNRDVGYLRLAGLRAQFTADVRKRRLNSAGWSFALGHYQRVVGGPFACHVPGPAAAAARAADADAATLAQRVERQAHMLAHQFRPPSCGRPPGVVFDVLLEELPERPFADEADTGAVALVEKPAGRPHGPVPAPLPCAVSREASAPARTARAPRHAGSTTGPCRRPRPCAAPGHRCRAECVP